MPGKEEFWGLVDWFQARLEDLPIDLRLGQEAQADDLIDFDEVIIATGVRPRDPEIPGQGGGQVHSYIDILNGTAKAGENVAVIGAGGIGFDVSEFLVHRDGESPTENLPEWLREWGVGDPEETAGGLAKGAQPSAAARQVTLLQRKAEKHGKRLGKTTGWIHRAALQMKDVNMVAGVNYEALMKKVSACHLERREKIPKSSLRIAWSFVPDKSLSELWPMC